MPPAALTFSELMERFEALARLASAEARIGVNDPDAARYARLLEFGSVAGRRPWPRPGPRTTLAVDPHTGAQVVVSAEAPQGFLRVAAPGMREELAGELARPARWLDEREVAAHLARSVRAAAVRGIERLRAGGPRSSGRLAAALALLD